MNDFNQFNIFNMALFTEVQHLHAFIIVALLIHHFLPIFGRRRTTSARPSLLMFRIDRPITHRFMLCYTGSLAVVLYFGENIVIAWT